MAEIIKDITANWNWEGDEFALQGFNIAVSEENENPKTKTVAKVFADSPKTTSGDYDYTYNFSNVKLDSNKNYKLWVQAVYPGFDSLWVDTAGQAAEDDGTATIEDSYAFQQKMDEAYENSKYFSKAHLIDDEDAHIFHFDKHLTSTKGLEPYTYRDITFNKNRGSLGTGIGMDVSTNNYVSGPESSIASWQSADVGIADFKFRDKAVFYCSTEIKGGWRHSCSNGDLELAPGNKATTSIWVKMGEDVDNFPSWYMQGRYYDTDTSSWIHYDPIHSYISREVKYYNEKMELVSGFKRGEWIKQVVIIENTHTDNIKLNSNWFFLSHSFNYGTIYHSMPQLEKRGFPTSFVNGSRGYSNLEYEVNYGRQGTLAWWMYATGKDYYGTGTFNFAVDSGGTGRNDIWTYSSAYEQSDRVWWYNENSGGWLYNYIDIDPKDLLFCVARWDMDTDMRYLTVYNYTQGTYNQTSEAGASALNFGKRLRFGYNSSYNGNNIFLETILLNKFVDDNTIKSWYKMDKPFVDLHPKTNTNTPTNVVLTEV